MRSQQLGVQLINTTSLNIQAQKNQELAFISRYNQVIECCNRNAQQGQLQMQVMVSNKFINRISHLFSRAYAYPLQIIILLIPFLNIICLATIILYFRHLRKESHKHKRNLERVQNPFINFYFLPQICQQMGKHHASLNLTPNQISGFTFNQELRTRLIRKLEQKQGKKDQKLTVIIYDQYFYDSFNLYKKQYNKAIVALFFGLCLTTLSTIFYLNVLEII